MNSRPRHTGARRVLKARDEYGTAALELVLIAPVLLVVMLFVIGLGRMAHARQEVESVAADAARAASLERNTAQSAAAARTAAQTSLGDAGLACTQLSVSVDISNYRPGGQVEVTVSCTAQLGDVALSGLGGSKVFTASSIVPIETHRANVGVPAT